jgi:hypothetical protein
MRVSLKCLGSQVVDVMEENYCGQGVLMHEPLHVGLWWVSNVSLSLHVDFTGLSLRCIPYSCS